GRRDLRVYIRGARQRQDREVGGRAGPREADRLAVGIGERLDRAVGAHVPEEIAGPGRLRAHDADRRALDEGRHDAGDAVAQSEVAALGDDGLERLGAAAGPGHVDLEILLLERALLDAEDGDHAVPDALLADR